MITVEEALAKVLALVGPVGSEQVSLAEAAGRVLAAPAIAQRDQPPFAASAMDGYAIANESAGPGETYEVIGESAAGHRFCGEIQTGKAVRIFTGAPLPKGAKRVVIQEDVTRSGRMITLSDGLGNGMNIRPAGNDFRAGSRVDPPRLLTASDIALLASMNIPEVEVSRKPAVALIATGDELVMPGETPSADQIIASNCFGLKALFEAHGAQARLLPIARDTEASLRAVFDLASTADLIVTIGGASVGDHDLVGKVAGDLGLERAFYKIAMRPGKPLMAGKIDGVPMIGLPGNPVSSMVCGHVFVLPALLKMLGLPPEVSPVQTAKLTAPLGANGLRAHYMRARLSDGKITPFNRQDSALLSVLSSANALLIRPVGDPAREIGDKVSFLPI